MAESTRYRGPLEKWSQNMEVAEIPESLCERSLCQTRTATLDRYASEKSVSVDFGQWDFAVYLL